jgi:hypothetical protein
MTVTTYTIRRKGSAAIVLENGKQVSAWLPVAQAEERASKLAKQHGFRTRKCMCCSSTFMSEGPHHRMCNTCRNKGSSAEVVPV